MQENNTITPKNEELDIVTYEVEDIKRLIYTVRGKQVMLDNDVAMLYHSETRVVNQTVKRNIERFPERFCFQVTQEEMQEIKLQRILSNVKKRNAYGGRRNLPTVFTEQGIAMLSALIKTEKAIAISINIMDAFVEMRKFIMLNGQVFQEINNIKNRMLEYDQKFDVIFDELQKEREESFKQKVFFKGQIYDAYEIIIDLIKSAKNKILIIDNYIDDCILEMLKKKNDNVEVVILTSRRCNISKLDIQKFNNQYPTLKISYTNKYHDRFIAIDNSELYLIGASIKDLGKKCFGIDKIKDKEYIEKICAEG